MGSGTTGSTLIGTLPPSDTTRSVVIKAHVGELGGSTCPYMLTSPSSPVSGTVTISPKSVNVYVSVSAPG